MKNNKKLTKLKEIIEGYGQMLVALSGGVDSVFLTAFAYKVWGDDRIAALTAYGPHFASDELRYSEYFCQCLGISHKKINVDNVLPLIEDNPEDRCYICKREIFSSLKERAEMVGSVLADGSNADDKNDFRPGAKAIKELGIASPLQEADLTKGEIREALKSLAEEDPALARALTISEASDALGSYHSMPLWEKPAFACLASRIPYGDKITAVKLESVYKAERLLKAMGFAQLRVRHHGDVARIEVLPEDRQKFFDVKFMNEVNDKIKQCGFRYVSLDLGGYTMGSLNPEMNQEG